MFYAEIGIGNDSFISAEIERGEEEYRINSFFVSGFCSVSHLSDGISQPMDKYQMCSIYPIMSFRSEPIHGRNPL